MHRYRSHTCNELRAEHVGEVARLSGWVHRVRDHGHLVFVDLRDHYGVTQCVVEADHKMFEAAQTLRSERNRVCATGSSISAASACIAI